VKQFTKSDEEPVTSEYTFEENGDRGFQYYNYRYFYDEIIL
jgi:hypothetical protein